MTSYLVLIGAGLVAGAMNAVAGGGSFFSFPALVFAGVPSVQANASSAMALYPGSVSSAWVYRDSLGGFEGISMGLLLGVSLAGGAVGAVLLLVTPQAAFDAAIPWLLLTGTLAFAFGRDAGTWLRRRVTIGPATLACAQFLLAIYGGYFGGAVGLMMMAVWTMFGVTDLRAMIGAKAWVVGATNTVAVACFAVAGQVAWPEAALLAVAATVGGYGGAHLGRRIPLSWLRGGIATVNVAVTAVFFWRAF